VRGIAEHYSAAEGVCCPLMYIYLCDSGPSLSAVQQTERGSGVI
jgi:hypothetical protein